MRKPGTAVNTQSKTAGFHHELGGLTVGAVPATLTPDGLLVGIALAAIAVEFARRRWPPWAVPARRGRRVAGLTVLAGAVVAAWPVMLFAAMMAGAFFIAVFVLGIRPAPPGRPPSAGPLSPAGHHGNHEAGAGEVGGYSHPGWHHDPYEEERIREQTRAAIERDEEDQRVHEWDQYRWENRSHPPSGPELW